MCAHKTQCYIFSNVTYFNSLKKICKNTSMITSGKEGRMGTMTHKTSDLTVIL